MALINDKIDIENFGACGGMGRCGTCKGEIIAMENKLSQETEVEQHSKKKLRFRAPVLDLRVN